jgi:hypothetical protein
MGTRLPGHDDVTFVAGMDKFIVDGRKMSCHMDRIFARYKRGRPDGITFSRPKLPDAGWRSTKLSIDDRSGS